MPKKNKNRNQVFCISSSNLDVIDILSKVGNKSQFICDAVREKYKNDQLDDILDSKEELLENKIKEVLMKLYGSNIAIVASSQQIVNQGSVGVIEKQQEQVDVKSEEKTNNGINEIEDDEREHLRKMFENW